MSEAIEKFWEHKHEYAIVVDQGERLEPGRVLCKDAEQAIAWLRELIVAGYQALAVVRTSSKLIQVLPGGRRSIAAEVTTDWNDLK